MSDQKEINHKHANSCEVCKLWRKLYILTLIAAFTSSITMTLFMPLLPIFTKVIGGSSSSAGLAVSIYTLAALIFRPIFAILIDKYGRKPILITGFLLLLISCCTYRFISGIGILFLIRIIHGIGYSASTNATGTIMADILPKELRSKGIGYYGFVTATSLALGPATGLLIMKTVNIKAAFTVAAILAFLGLAASCFITYEKRNSPKNIMAGSSEQLVATVSNRSSNKPGFNFGYEKTALSPSIIMLLVAFAYAGVMTFLPTYAGTLGIEQISIFFIVYAVVLLITRIIVDQVTRRRDVSAVLLPGIAFMSVAFVLLATVKTLPLFLIAAIFYGIGYGSVQPTLNVIVISLCEPSKRGAANSTFFSALDMGIGLGALIWGLISQLYGYPAIYFGCIGIMLLAIAAYFVRQ
jgi:MFS family permease